MTAEAAALAEGSINDTLEMGCRIEAAAPKNSLLEETAPAEAKEEAGAGAPKKAFADERGAGWAIDRLLGPGALPIPMSANRRALAESWDVVESEMVGARKAPPGSSPTTVAAPPEAGEGLPKEAPLGEAKLKLPADFSPAEEVRAEGLSPVERLLGSAGDLP